MEEDDEIEIHLIESDEEDVAKPEVSIIYRLPPPLLFPEVSL